MLVVYNNSTESTIKHPTTFCQVSSTQLTPSTTSFSNLQTAKKMSKSEHRHRGIKERHLREGYRNIFKPELFSSSSLARHVVAFSKLRGSAMTRMQAKAMHRFHHEKIYDLSQKIHTVRGGASGSASDIDVFQAYCDLFDDLFFFGSLKGNCKFHLGEEGDAEKSGETASRDETKKRSLKRRGRIFYVEVQKRCDIYLYAPSVRSSSRAERLLVVLGSLLHGMAHAFLILWACHHKGCIGDNSEHKCK